jgi:hypothetical protein
MDLFVYLIMLFWLLSLSSGLLGIRLHDISSLFVDVAADNCRFSGLDQP